jgi:hypothetical protein
MIRSSLASRLAVTGILAVALATGTARRAYADVEHAGAWPTAEQEKKVSLALDHVSQREALTKLAEAAGWNLVLRMNDEGEKIDLHVKDESPAKVLDIILDGGSWLAKRDGNLVSIRTAADAAAPAAVAPAVVAPEHADAAVTSPPPEAPPLPSVRGADRVVNGDDAVVEKDEIVHDISVVGGDLEVKGTVTGNAVVTGGKMKVVKGAHIVGSATTVGGELDVEDDAQIDGQVGVVGGVLHRGHGAKVGSATTIGDHEGRPGVLQEIGDALTRSALLFVFGAVLFALAGARMDRLRAEVAAKPMRTFALGIVGFFGAILAVVALAISVIGIPVAIFAIPVAVFASYAGICAVLSTAGKAVLGHKTDSPYVHLLAGCAMFLVLGSLPWIGGLVTFAVIFLGIGSVVASRGAGFVRSGKDAPPSGGDPYRTIST